MRQSQQAGDAAPGVGRAVPAPPPAPFAGPPQSRAPRRLAAMACCSLAAGMVAAEDPDAPPDKSRYNLFNPTPRELMRELVPDRPDKTESAYTVDAGHVQIEMDAVIYAHDRGDTTTDALALAPMNLKVGLLNRVDLQLLLAPYNRVHESAPSTAAEETRSGFGGLATRLKVNLWGDDHGPTALAVMPFVIFPTSQINPGNGFQGGVIFPFALNLGHGWDLGAMTEFDIRRNESTDGYHAAFINSVTFSHALIGKLAGYVEFFSAVSAEQDAPWIGTADFGLTYQLNPNVQLDTGVNVGLTQAADDFQLFAGLTWRF